MITSTVRKKGSPIPRDTSLEAARNQFAILRGLGMEDRAGMAFRLSDELRAITKSGVRLRHPDYDDEMVRLAVIRLTIGEQLFRQFYPGMEVKP